MGVNAKNRYQAFGIHFLISLFVVANFAFLILSQWYPEPFFTADGGWSVFRMIIVVDLILGPFLTLIIFKPGKKGLKFDLSAIATVQVAALLYGGVLLYQERPAYLAFSVDRFALVSENDIDTSKIKYSSLLNKNVEKPQLVYARLPEDLEEHQKFMKEVFAGGPDLEFRPEYYEPFADNFQTVMAKSVDVDLLKTVSEENRQKIDSFLENHCLEGCGYFPLVGKKNDVLLAINKKNGTVVGGIDVDPWKTEKTLKTVTNNKK